MIIVKLPSANQDRTVWFYTNYFGFQKRGAHGPVVWIKGPPGFSLAIEEVERKEEFPSTFRLEFLMDSRHEAEAVLHALLKDGVEVTYPLSGSSDVSIAFSANDPDGRCVFVYWIVDSKLLK